MNFEQAREYSFIVPWKAIECFSGPQCWCRIIVPMEPIFYTHPDMPDIKHEYSIVDAGSIDQQTAEYIVKLHNEHYERVKQSCRDAMKETIDSLIPLTYKDAVLNIINDPTLDYFPIIKRKEID